MHSRAKTESIVEFCRFAREHGISIGVSETIDAVRAAEAVAPADMAIFQFALRAILCSSPEDWTLFDDLFTAFWRTPDGRIETGSKTLNRGPAPPPRAENAKARGVLPGFGDSSDSGSQRERKAFSGASTVERLRKIDFAEMQQTDLAELERLSTRLLRRMSFRVARRLRPKKHRYSIDLRRTLRRSISRGGECIDLRYKGPKRERARLVILLDVSDSMNPYSFFLLKFAYALGRQSRNVRSFIFSTLLVEVGETLRARRLSDALKMLSTITTGWSGGTRIGVSLHEFNRRHAPRLTSRRTVFVILSDGWDTGEPEDLRAELRKIQARVSKVIWLNPLLGLEDYQPSTRGIRAALPYIDLFAPAHNLESLLALEGHLRRAMPR